jgi:hypothetical protein
MVNLTTYFPQIISVAGGFFSGYLLFRIQSRKAALSYKLMPGALTPDQDLRAYNVLFTNSGRASAKSLKCTISLPADHTGKAVLTASNLAVETKFDEVNPRGIRFTVDHLPPSAEVTLAFFARSFNDSEFRCDGFDESGTILKRFVARDSSWRNFIENLSLIFAVLFCLFAFLLLLASGNVALQQQRHVQEIEYRNQVADILLKAGDFKGAQQQLIAALRESVSPPSPSLLFNLVRSSAALEQDDVMIAAMKKLKSLGADELLSVLASDPLVVARLKGRKIEDIVK